MIQDRCSECIEQNLEVCVPQWGATRPSKACRHCASCKKSCNPPKEWLEQVKSDLHPERAGLRGKGMSTTF